MTMRSRFAVLAVCAVSIALSGCLTAEEVEAVREARRQNSWNCSA